MKLEIFKINTCSREGEWKVPRRIERKSPWPCLLGLVRVYFCILLSFTQIERGFKSCHFASDSPNALWWHTNNRPQTFEKPIYATLWRVDGAQSELFSKLWLPRTGTVICGWGIGWLMEVSHQPSIGTLPTGKVVVARYLNGECHLG